MPKIISFILFFFILGSTLSAQTEINFPKKDKGELNQIRSNKNVDLNGLWEGKVSQLNWQGQPEFKGVSGKLHVEIQHRGTHVNGLFVCRAKFANNMGYLSYEKHFTGRWDGEQLHYQDTRIENYINTHKELRHLESCIKTADLDFYKIGNTLHLEGEWTGNGHISEIACTPGTIHLTKILEEELILEEATTYNVSFNKTDKGPVAIQWDKNNQIKKIKNRKVEKGKIIQVDSNYLSITVYDHQKDDGDIISLNYNGNWILQKYEIQHEAHQVDVFLDTNEKAPNYLILYAHNLGETPPNTVAVVVDDGIRRQRFILNADMHTSDVIYFEYTPQNK